MERFVLPVWDRAVSVIRRKSEASSEALEAPSIMRTHLGGEVHLAWFIYRILSFVNNKQKVGPKSRSHAICMHVIKRVKTGINKGGINDSPYLMSGAYYYAKNVMI